MEKPQGMSRTKKLVGMFAATVLVATTAVGCSEETSSDCNDYDNDGYCDDDGSGTYGYKKVKKSSKSSSGTVSTGKGGVGSSSKGSTS